MKCGYLYDHNRKYILTDKKTYTSDGKGRCELPFFISGQEHTHCSAINDDKLRCLLDGTTSLVECGSPRKYMVTCSYA